MRERDRRRDKWREIGRREREIGGEIGEIEIGGEREIGGVIGGEIGGER